MIFKKKLNSRNFFFHFVLFHLMFPCYYCSIGLAKQSEHSGPRPDTSSLVCFLFKSVETVSFQFYKKVRKCLPWAVFFPKKNIIFS